MYSMPFELRSHNCLSTTDDNLNSEPVRFFAGFNRQIWLLTIPQPAESL